jgi:formylglycine-generating enzyme required for sulfatase activity/serine/threonine protein kinase
MTASAPRAAPRFLRDPPMQTALDKIRELHALHEDGLLSREEFDARKNAILDAAFMAREGDAGLRAGTEIGLMAGQEIGPQNRRYRLERLIAHGGMGQVWQATDLATQAELGHSAQVALKIVPQQFTRSAGHAKLLVEEATRARRLAHEHIVRVYEWAQDPATASYFIIMEYLDGEDLDRLLAREGKLPLARVGQLLAPVAAALDYAWDKHRLVHRDLKPSNVFVTKKGDVKLLDFGIAARSRANSAALEAPASSGTAGYRAPEAGDARLAPSRALDVYAVAVMIYQMLAGRLPFDGPRADCAEPPQPAGLADAGWGVLRAGLAADPASRPASASELLDRIRAEAGPSVPSSFPRRREPMPSLRTPMNEARPHTQHGFPPSPPREIQEAPAAPGQQAAEQPDPPPKTDAEARALAEARVKLARQRREQEKKERAAGEAARRARKEVLREQLRARRAEEADKARLAQAEAQRKALQAKAVAAYEAEQRRAQAQASAPTEPGSEARPAPQVVAATDRGSGAQAGADGLLRDRFIDGSGAGPELVLIPAGRFQMGSPERERQLALAAGTQAAWLAREQPRHWVGIERPIAMGRYPVTVGEWREFVRATGWQQHGEVNWAAPGFPQADEHPVVGVTWWDAQKYVEWLGERTGQRYRLPSEAEWEYACRAGAKTAFSFGDTISTDLANYDGSFTYNGGKYGEYRRGTTPVSQFAPNRWGLHDMHGNVWEWVQDVVHDSYEGAPTDGGACEQGGDPARRVLRGGSWSNSPRYLRSALRNGFSAALANDIVGFRVVRDACSRE